jgi:hypothetical protein
MKPDLFELVFSELEGDGAEAAVAALPAEIERDDAVFDSEAVVVVGAALDPVEVGAGGTVALPLLKGAPYDPGPDPGAEAIIPGTVAGVRFIEAVLELRSTFTKSPHEELEPGPD